MRVCVGGGGLRKGEGCREVGLCWWSDAMCGGFVLVGVRW